MKPTRTTLQTHPPPAVLPPSLHPFGACQVPPQPASAWVYAFPAVRVPLRPYQDCCERPIMALSGAATGCRGGCALHPAISSTPSLAGGRALRPRPPAPRGRGRGRAAAAARIEEQPASESEASHYMDPSGGDPFFLTAYGLRASACLHSGESRGSWADIWRSVPERPRSNNSAVSNTLQALQSDMPC